MSARLEAALGYAGLGRSVIPVVPGGKLPALPSWKRYQAERATGDRIRHWWARQDWNVGIVTGAISGVVIVDVDLRKPEAADTMAMLAATIGLPPTPEVTTATGGIHLWYQHPGPGIRVPNSAGQFASGLKTPGVDVRGDGGFAVCPPSIRPEGAYTWCEWLCELALLPPALLEHLVERKPVAAKPSSPWRQRVQAATRTLRSAYAQQAIDDELRQLTQEGGHAALTRSAYRLGQLHHLSGLNDSQAEQLIEQLADSALVNAGGARSKPTALKTARSCYTAGKDNPRNPK
jgi:hypothetical protein